MGKVCSHMRRNRQSATQERVAGERRRLVFDCADGDTEEPARKRAAEVPRGQRWRLGRLVVVECPRHSTEFAHLRDKTGLVAGSREVESELWYTVRFGEGSTEDIPAKYLRLDGLGASTKDVTFISISQVFKRCPLHRVPVFQRRYCWGLEQFENLWQSVHSMSDADDNVNNHSMGRLLLFTRPDGSRLVLDGQQRLTTISLFLCAMLDRFEALGEGTLGRSVKSHIFARDGSFCLVPTLDDRSDYATAMKERRPEGVGALLDCKRFFADRLSTESEDRVMNLANALLNRVSTLAMVIENEESIQPLFENLAKRNFRVKQQLAEFQSKGIPTLVPPPPGVDMSYVDLIRSFVFEHFATEDEMRQAHATWWSKMENACDSTEELESALVRFLEARGFVVGSEATVYGSFCSWWQSTVQSGGTPDAHLKFLSDAIVQLVSQRVA